MFSCWAVETSEGRLDDEDAKLVKLIFEEKRIKDKQSFFFNLQNEFVKGCKFFNFARKLGATSSKLYLPKTYFSGQFVLFGTQAKGNASVISARRTEIQTSIDNLLSIRDTV